MNLRVSLFGNLAAAYPDHPLELPNACKALELFCYIFLHSKYRHHREKLATLLWSDVSTELSKGYLRKALWQLQTALDASSCGKQQRPIILVEPEWVFVNPELDLWVDVQVFENAFNLLQDVAGAELSGATVQTLQSAVELYRGELMEGLFEDWCLRARERLQLMYLSMLEKLIDYCEVHGEYEAGILYGVRILQHDEAREAGHRALMRLYYLSGHRVEALRQYQRCTSILKKELDVQPSKPTHLLYEQIKAEQFEPVHHTGEKLHSRPEAMPPLLIELSGQLHLMRETLSNLQYLIQNHTEA